MTQQDAWELYETETRELHVRRPHDPNRTPAGRILTYGGRRPSRTHGFDVVAIVMPVYVRSKTGRRFRDTDEGECEAVPNRTLAERILTLMETQ